MTLTSRRTATVLVSASGLALLGATAAYAVWSTSGSGVGQATAGSASALVVTSTANVGGLYPTGTGTAGSLSVKNNNSFGVTITAKGFGAVSVDKAGCTPTTVTFGFGAAQPTSIAAGQTVSIPITASMSNAAEDACQGAVFSSILTVTGASA